MQVKNVTYLELGIEPDQVGLFFGYFISILKQKLDEEHMKIVFQSLDESRDHVEAGTAPFLDQLYVDLAFEVNYDGMVTVGGKPFVQLKRCSFADKVPGSVVTIPGVDGYWSSFESAKEWLWNHASARFIDAFVSALHNMAPFK